MRSITRLVELLCTQSLSSKQSIEAGTVSLEDLCDRSRTPSASFIFAESLRSLAKEAPAPVEISGDTDLGQDDSVMMRGNKRRNMKTRLERRILKEKSFAFCFASMRDRSKFLGTNIYYIRIHEFQF